MSYFIIKQLPRAALPVAVAKTFMPTIQVILMHLLQKDMAGSRRARNVLLKYREFANRGAGRKLDVRFADNSYAPTPALKSEDKA